MTSDFSKLGLSDDIVKAIDEMGWTEPTPIQVEAVPVGIGGRDILAQAQTGTGKTGTYGSIILSRIKATQGGWPQALILTPTRELALQVSEELERLSKYTGHRNIPVYGGVSMLRQTQDMDRGVDIIVATPGRLCDHLKNDERLLEDVSIVVLDESDRMLDMGFRRDLEFIMGRIPEEGRQTMLFSATMSKDIRKLALDCLDDPKEICVSKDEMVLDLIDQQYMMVEKDDKVDTLRYVLAKEPMKTIVFCFTKYRVDKVVRKLKMSFKLAGIHGEYSQNRREETLRKFKEGSIEVLVASDIAARGLDIEDVERVINFDMPPEAETYVHRIGRTGRAGKRGIALSFVMREDRKLMKEIENLTLIPMEEIPAPTKGEMDEVFSGIKELSRPVMAKKNSRKNDVPVKEKVFVVAEMNVGKEDGLSRPSIAQMIKEHTTVPKKSIGDIYVGERTSTLQIEKRYFSKTEDGLSKCDVNGKSIKLWKISEIEGLELKQTLEDEPSPKGDGSKGNRSKDDGPKGKRKSSDDRRSDRPKDDRRKCDDHRSYSDRPRRDDDRRSNGDRRPRRDGDRRPRSDDDRRSYREGDRRSNGDRERTPRSRGDGSYGDRPRRDRQYGSGPRYGDRRDGPRRGRSYGDGRRDDSDNHKGARRYDNDRPRSGSYRSGDDDRGYRSRDRFQRPRESRRYRE